MKNDRPLFKERIKAGEQMRKELEKILERASEGVEQAMHLFGDREAALRVFPETFDLVEKKEKRIAEIDKKLEELRSELDKLKGKEAP
jgi:vacuolar-type H+-ATPase subunit I/STV1